MKAAGSIYHRVLAGTDGSRRAEEAVRQAIRMAVLTGARLEVVHVFDRALATVPLGGTEAVGFADGILAEAMWLAGEQGVEAEVRFLGGHPSSSLAREARERWCDLVCVGSDASFLEKPHLLGGVAIHLLREITSSVLVARSPAYERPFPSRILCGVDGTLGSLEAVQEAASLASVAGAELRLVRVEERSGSHVDWTPAPDDHPGFASLELARSLARQRGVDPSEVVALGEPASTIVELAREWEADLVIVGSRGLHGVPRVVLGSVSEGVARSAPCSVLVSRPRPG